MLCCECGSEMRWTDEPMTEEFKGVEFTVDGIGRYVCDSCGNDVMDVKEAERLSRTLASEYAKAQGLLSPDDIRSFRKKVGLTQKEFEKLLGVSSPTASRWESGAMQQSKQADMLIRIYMGYPDVLEDALAKIGAGRFGKGADVASMCDAKTVGDRRTNAWGSARSKFTVIEGGKGKTLAVPPESEERRMM